MGGVDPYVNSLTDSIARWAVDAAAASVLYLFHYISRPTDPIFATLTPVYNRVLAMALLLAGGVIAFALLERIVGGRRGAGPEVVLRTLAACGVAMVGLPVMRYAVNVSDLMATVWNIDVLNGAVALVNQGGPGYQPGATHALGSSLGLILAALLTVLLAILVHLELILRAALLSLTTAFLPLVCVMAIWPRMAGALTHMVGFLLALLLSKFVIATAIYLGFAMVLQTTAPGGDASGALLTGLATLTAAVLAPVVLLQGIRFTEAGAAHATRGFAMASVRGAGLAGRGTGQRLAAAATKRLPSLGRRSPASAVKDADSHPSAAGAPAESTR